MRVNVGGEDAGRLLHHRSIQTNRHSWQFSISRLKFNNWAMQSLVMLNTSSTSHPNSLVMLVFVSGAPVPCYADRVWPNPLHVVCGPTRQRWRDGFNLLASSTLQCSSGFNCFKFVKRQFIWRIFSTSWNDLSLQAGSCATWPEDSGRNNLPTWNNLSFLKVSLLNHHFGMKFDWPEFIRHRCCTWDFRYIKNHWYALSRSE